jgi:hypothetical protein
MADVANQRNRGFAEPAAGRTSDCRTSSAAAWHFPPGGLTMFLIGFVIGAMATVTLAVLVDA